MHTVSQYNVSEVVRQCFWGRGTEKYGQRAVFAHGWVMMCTTLENISVIGEIRRVLEGGGGLFSCLTRRCV